MCVLHIFDSGFFIVARSIMTRSYFVPDFSSRSARVSMKHQKYTFYQYFIDKSSAPTKDNFVIVLGNL